MVAMKSITCRIHRLEDLHCLKAEMELRKQLLQSLAVERTRIELAHAASTADSELIEMLFHAGFTAETLPALTLAPIALVAWGSGYVTDEERAIAMRAVFDSDLSGNGPAIAKFQSWLDERPDPNLFYLWANVTTDQIKRVRSGTQEAIGDRMIRMAEQVARASGGFLGFGSICSGEQDVIDSVRHVFQR
ncbi:MAG: hypothetical protein WBD31_28645 [Rubripirellula sp.]